jgi:hypothetical protein
MNMCLAIKPNVHLEANGLGIDGEVTTAASFGMAV